MFESLLHSVVLDVWIESNLTITTILVTDVPGILPETIP